MTSKQYKEIVRILNDAGCPHLATAITSSTGYDVAGKIELSKGATRDQKRLQFILDYITGHGTEGFTFLLNKTPWTIYKHDGEDTVAGFDRRTIDWMIKNHDKATAVEMEACATKVQAMAAGMNALRTRRYR